eukprot:746011-Hanusia_phi.AAC.4
MAAYYGARALAGAAILATSVKMARSDHAPPPPSPQQSIPSSVELHCSPLSPSCSSVTAFFRKLRVDCKVVDVSPLKGYEITKAGESLAMSWGMHGRARPADTSRGQLWTEMRPSSHPFPPLERAEEDQWCEWAEKVLHPNVEINLFRSPADAKQSMDSIIARMGLGGMSSTLLRNVGSLYLYMTAKLTKREIIQKAKGEESVSLNDKSALRIALNSFLEQWMSAVGNREMMGGAEPNLADLAVFGVLRSVEGSETFKEVLEQTRVSSWYHRVAAATNMEK